MVTRARRLADSWHRIRDGWSPSVEVAADALITDKRLLDTDVVTAVMDDLQRKVNAETPWRWRYDEARWHLRQTRVALRGGHSTIAYPWEYRVEAYVTDDAADLFDRNATRVVVTKRRVPAPW